MVTCPDGHSTSGDDPYCDVCGVALATPPAPAPAPTPAGETCANCGASRVGRFCEDCGHDASVPVAADSTGDAESAAEPGAWTAVVRADRDWFDEVRARNGPDAATLEFPRYCGERRFRLTGDQLQIGRTSRSRGIHPDIDLTGPPLDPGVSTLHALLVRDGDGWQVIDLDSTNGTSVGDTADLIPPNTPVPLADGSVLRLGAFTTITITH